MVQVAATVQLTKRVPTTDVRIAATVAVAVVCHSSVRMTLVVRKKTPTVCGSVQYTVYTILVFIFQRKQNIVVSMATFFFKHDV